jgi:4-amino-4-deoxy-L-arabinose transferase-like glycosyltransferase
VVIPLACAALVGALSLWGLGHRPFWLDEGLTVGATTELGATIRGTGGTMALFYALLTPLSHLGVSREWLRFPSVVFAMAAMPVIYATARRAFDRRVAGLAAAFTAGSWLTVRYAQSARSYALVLLLVAVSWWALIKAVQATDPGEQRRAWWVFTAAAVLAPLAHGLALLQLGGQLVWLALGPDRGRHLRRARSALVGSVLVTTALLSIGAGQVAGWVPPMDREQVVQLLSAFTGPTLAAALLLGAAVVTGTRACVVRYRTDPDPERRWWALLPIAWGLVPTVGLIVLSLARPYLVARYVAASAPGIGMLLAVTATDPAWGPKRSRQAVVVVISLLLLAGQVDLHRVLGDDWAGAARAIATDARPGDGIVFTNPSVRSAFDFAWDELPDAAKPTTPHPVSPLEPLGDVRRFYWILPFHELPDAAVTSHRDRLWLVDQEGKSLDDELARFLRDPRVRATFVVERQVELSGGVRFTLIHRR